MLSPDSAKQGSVCVHVGLPVSFSQAFVIFGSKAISSPINNNTLASLSDIYSRKTKTEQLESQHD